MATKRRSRPTVGYNAQIFVAKAINYTDDANLAAFVANAPVGELGVFDANDVTHTNLITSAESFYIAMKMTNGIKRTPLYKFTDVAAYKKAYVAPVKQVSSIGWTGTGGSLNAGTIIAGDTFLLKVIETTEAFEPYPTWNYEVTAKATDVQADIVQYLAKKINDDNAAEHKQNQRLISAKVKMDATYGNYAATTGSTFTLVATNGSVEITYGGTTPTYDVAVGDYISFDAAATPTDAVGDVYKVVAAVAAVGFTLNRPYQGATQTFTEAEAEGTRIKKVTSIVEVGLELTALDEDTHFRTAVSGELVDATMTIKTAFVRGNGTYQKVRDLEIEGETYEGDTAKNVRFADDFGIQDIFSVSGETYDIYHFPFLKSIESVAPFAQSQHKGQAVIAVAKSTGNADTTLDTLFGL